MEEKFEELVNGGEGLRSEEQSGEAASQQNEQKTNGTKEMLGWI